MSPWATLGNAVMVVVIRAVDLDALGDGIDDGNVPSHVDDIVAGGPHHDSGDVLSDVVGVSLSSVHDDGGFGLPSAGDLFLGDGDSNLHGLGSHHDLGQVVDVLGVQLGHDLHSSNESVVDDIEGVPLFDGLGDDGSNGLEPHVHDFLGDLVENRVLGE